MSISIQDLKKHLGPGLGLRNNKYLLEIPYLGVDGAKFNVLARSTGLPERSVAVSDVFHKGRKYTLRGETDYGGTYNISILDDSSMTVRKRFDLWMLDVDNSNASSSGMFGGTSYESGINTVLNNINSGVAAANKLAQAMSDPINSISGFVVNALDLSKAYSTAKYQTDVNIWQLSANSDKIYGYRLQNAFPSQVGIVELDDSNANALSEFSVTFSFSEFVSLEGVSAPRQVVNALLGTRATTISNKIGI